MEAEITGRLTDSLKLSMKVEDEKGPEKREISNLCDDNLLRDKYKLEIKNVSLVGSR